jgi:hypothetical protein
MKKIKIWTVEQLIEYGYSNKLLYLNDLVDIWNIISDNYEFENQYLILPTDIFNKVNDFIISTGLHKRLTKKWDTYKNKLPMNNGVISIDDYTKLIEASREQERLRKIREEERQLQLETEYKEDLQTLAVLKETYQDSWLNEDWIKAMIGTYDNPFAEYYWTIIGRKGYKVKDWKGNLSIREDIYNTIYNDHTFKSYSGRKFLTNSFKNKKGYCAYIQDTYAYITADESGYGIYGIYYTEDDTSDSELIYIGMTQKGFLSRWQEHMKIFKGEMSVPSGMILYQQHLDPSKISFSKLININELKYEGSIGLQELKAMELGCITVLAPKYNIVGVSKPYIL